MDELILRKLIYDYIKEICHLSQMQVFATSYYQKNYFQLQMDEKINELIDQILQSAECDESEMDVFAQQEKQQDQKEQQVQQDQQEQPQQGEQTRVFTADELAQFDGTKGNPAYVAMNGTVYDMTNVTPWAGGTHFGMVAGKDLSIQFMGCHQGMVQILQKVPRVGILKV